MSNIAVIGATSWGTTLATVLAKSGHKVRIWSRDVQEHAVFLQEGPFIDDLKSPFQFHRHITPTLDMSCAMYQANVALIAVPSQTMRDNARALAPYLNENTLVISASKGLEDGSHKRMTEVVREELPLALRNNVMALSGPNIAREIMDGMPAVTVIASEKAEKATLAHDILSTKDFYLYTNTDIIGTELGGALKNIIALGAGILDGLQMGDNIKAALITRGLTEISALGQAMGANPLTFAGLAGMGDLIVTCQSPASRNHYFGVQLGLGRCASEITIEMKNVAEGVPTTKAAYEIARQMDISMPITEKIYAILYAGAPADSIIQAILAPSHNHEFKGHKWNFWKFLERNK